MKTTLNQIRECHPCKDGWKKLLAHLGKTKADDEPLSIITILDSNGLDNALWCLQAVKGFDREKRLYAVRCARRVQHLMTDQRSIDALDVAERFANGEATQDDLIVARAAANSAAGVAKGAAAKSAAYAAADASWDAVCDAGWAAGRAARDVRAAAYDAAWVAAWDATHNPARAAWVAAYDAQEKDLREMCAACEVTA